MMTKDEALRGLTIGDCRTRREAVKTVKELLNREVEPRYNSIKSELKPCDDAISRQAVLDAIDVKAWEFCDYLISKNRNDEQKPVSHFADTLRECVREELPSVNPQPKTGQYEKHIDHTDCIWYGNDSGCPVTCSQYRDGWNDAMDYIFKNGKGYQPYRHDG